MNILSAKYMKDEQDEVYCINAVIDGFDVSIPLDPANRHYAEILRQVEAGELTIAPAE